MHDEALAPNIEVADFRTNSLPQAAALGTMGVNLWPELSLVLGGKSTFDESRERRWYQYDGKAICPGGFRDGNNTWLDTITASQLISWHKQGRLVRMAPNHVFYAMISASVNRARLLEHLLKQQAVSQHMVMPPDLAEIPEHQGAAHFQLFREEENTDTPMNRDEVCGVTNFDTAVSLLTIGFRFDPSRTEVRESEGHHSFRLWLENNNANLGKVDPYLQFLKGDAQKQRGPVWDHLEFCHTFLQNRKRLQAELDNAPAQLICTAPDEFVDRNRDARSRVAQVHEDSLDREEQDIVEFFGRKKKHY